MKRLFLAISMAVSCSVYSQTVQTNALDGTMILKVKAGYSTDFVADLGNNSAFQLATKAANVNRVYQSFKGLSVDLDHYVRLEFTNLALTDQLIKTISALPFIERVENYPLLKVDNVPNDFKPLQWHLPMIKAQQGWLMQLGSANIVVAVSDNAILTSHPDLEGVIYHNPREIKNNGIDDDQNGYVDDFAGFDIADNDSDPQPPSDNFDDGQVDASWHHGTSTSGLVGAHTNNLEGIASIGYGISILPIKSTYTNFAGAYITHGYEAVVYATVMKADVINMSWGSIWGGDFAQQIVHEAYSRGVVLVGSAGNDGDNVPHYPAAFEEVIGVGATNVYDQKAGFSCYGPSVDVMAPGDMIYTTTHGYELETDIVSGYDFFSGTSASAPIVAGLAGLIKSVDPEMSAIQLAGYLIGGCDNIDLYNFGFEGQLGAGRINAERSLTLAGARLLNTGITEENNSCKIFQKDDQLFVELNSAIKTELIISDIQGRIFHNQAYQQQLIKIDIEAKGLLIARLVDENGKVSTIKFYTN